MSYKEQIILLSDFIIDSVDGEPSRSEGAGDCAIRIIIDLMDEVNKKNQLIKEMSEFCGYDSLNELLNDMEEIVL